MPLWFPTSRPTPAQGKFQRRRSTGLDAAAGSDYRGWSIQLVQHRSVGAMPRSRFHAVICDPRGERRAYLQGFSSASQAASAARNWIDDAENASTA